MQAKTIFPSLVVSSSVEEQNQRNQSDTDIRDFGDHLIWPCHFIDTDIEAQRRQGTLQFHTAQIVKRRWELQDLCYYSSILSIKTQWRYSEIILGSFHQPGKSAELVPPTVGISCLHHMVIRLLTEPEGQTRDLRGVSTIGKCEKLGDSTGHLGNACDLVLVIPLAQPGFLNPCMWQGVCFERDSDCLRPFQTIPYHLLL